MLSRPWFFSTKGSNNCLVGGIVFANRFYYQLTFAFHGVEHCEPGSCRLLVPLVQNP